MNKRRGCLDCGSALVDETRDHLYGFDRGPKILLRDITYLVCSCGYYEVCIPRMGPLHDAITEALNVLRTKRDRISFFFSPGDHGVRDGAWGVRLRGADPNGA